MFCTIDKSKASRLIILCQQGRHNRDDLLDVPVRSLVPRNARRKALHHNELVFRVVGLVLRGLARHAQRIHRHNFQRRHTLHKLQKKDLVSDSRKKHRRGCLLFL